MKKEVLESIVYPSHIISDQYRGKSVITTSGQTYTGLVAVGPDGDTIVLNSKGEKQVVPQDDIKDIVVNQKSVMPENLLDSLSLAEISDLFAYLGLLPANTIATRRVTSSPR